MNKTCINCLMGNNIYEAGKRHCINGASPYFDTLRNENDTCDKHCFRKSENYTVFGPAWISPDGKIYKCEAHEADAEDIVEKLHFASQGLDNADDTLEKLGWIKVSHGAMWKVRIKDGYWKDKHLTQAQQNMLWDWCMYNEMPYPL